MPNPASNHHDVIVAAVIPCYRETARISAVIEGIGPEVGLIVIVDDACPDGTGAHVRAHCRDPRVEVIVQARNTGVGGATAAGYLRALERGAGIVVKLDGDGQMDPAMIPKLIRPIQRGRADYAKGNRFWDLDGLAQMPWHRILGNLLLSFMNKLSSGYWDVFDPTNGFTAIHAEVLRRLPLGKIARGFFFESDMLFRLNTIRAVVIDVPMAAHYGGEISSIRLGKVAIEFPYRHLVNLTKRIFYAYFLRDFSVASLQLVLGFLMTGFGGVFGIWAWHESVASGRPATTGTVFLAALPIIVGVQLLLSFLDFDSRSLPREPLQNRL